VPQAIVEKLAGVFTEGPTDDPDGNVLFSDPLNHAS
jgi:hypothetical protein